jgi:Tfp pilus assembly protein PilO
VNDANAAAAAPKHFPWHLAGIAGAICLGMTLAAYAVGVQPLLKRRQQEAAQQQALRDHGASASQLSDELTALLKELTETKQALTRTSLRLQPASLINQRLESLARLATDCGVSIDEMRPGVAADAAHYQTVPVRIVGSGKYPAVVSFTRNLRKSFGDIGVQSFIIASDNANPNVPLAKFQADLVWYTELPRK